MKRDALAIRFLVAGVSAILASALLSPDLHPAAASPARPDAGSAPRQVNSGADPYSGSLAAPRKPSLTIRVPRRAKAGQSMRIEGSVKRDLAGVRIAIERSPGGAGGWTAIGWAKSTPSARYSIRTTALSGSYSYRAVATRGKRILGTSQAATVRTSGKFVRAKVRANVQSLSGASVAAIDGEPGGPRVLRLKKSASLPREGRPVVIKPGGVMGSGEAGKVSEINRAQRSFTLTPVPATDIYADLRASFDTPLADQATTVQAFTNGSRGRQSLSASAPEFSCNGTLTLDNRAVRVDLSSVRVQFAMDLGKKQLSLSTTGKPSILSGADAVQGVSGTCSLFYPVTQKAIGHTGFVLRVGPVVQVAVSASGRVRIGMRLDMPYTAGLSINGKQVSYTRGGQYSLSPTVSVESEAGLSAGLAIQVELTWLRLAAVQGTLGPEIKGTLRPSGNQMCARVDGNLVTDLTANASRIAKNWDFQLAGHTWRLRTFYDQCRTGMGGDTTSPPVDPSPSQSMKPSPPPPEFTDPQTISAGAKHTCALDRGGYAWCWGWDQSGEIGDGYEGQNDGNCITEFSNDHCALTPTRVAGERRFTTIDAGAWGTCALDAAGTAWCWGNTPATTLAFVPTAVHADQAFASISTDYVHACAIDTVGQAWCWGQNSEGQLGTGDTGPAWLSTRVTGEHRFLSIAASGVTTCAIDTDKRVWCWGGNAFGELGIGQKTDRVLTPTRAATDRTFVSISGGGDGFCALTQEGDSWCWGTHGYFEPTLTSLPKLGHVAPLGFAFSDYCGVAIDGSTWCGEGATAYRLWGADMPPMNQMAFSPEHVCAVTREGRAWCSGSNKYGQLGTGESLATQRSDPAPVDGDAVFATTAPMPVG